MSDNKAKAAKEAAQKAELDKIIEAKAQEVKVKKALAKKVAAAAKKAEEDIARKATQAEVKEGKSKSKEKGASKKSSKETKPKQVEYAPVGSEVVPVRLATERLAAKAADNVKNR